MERITISPGVRYRDLGGEAVLLELESGRYFGLDEVAACMWTQLAEHGALEPTIEALLDQLEVTPERLRADLLDFIHELEAHALLTCGPGATAAPSQ